MSAAPAPDVLLIGTGRMAFHLGHALVRAGIPLVGVMGRDATRSNALAKTLRTAAVPWRADPPMAGLTLLAVSDDAVTGVARMLTPRAGTLAHTSGAQGLDVLAPHPHRGVLWPIQSLSPGEAVEFGNVPVAVEGNDAVSQATVEHVARSISGRVLGLPLEKRQLLHLAAVFASNFPVFLMDRAQELLRREELPDDLLMPLWNATAAKVGAVGPSLALTGPARRGDRRTIRKHLERLTGDADLRRAYALLSRMIASAHGPKASDDEDLQGTPR